MAGLARAGRPDRHAERRHMGRRRSSPGELRRQIAALAAAPTVGTTLRDATDVARQSVPFADWIWLIFDPQPIIPPAALADGLSLAILLAPSEHQHSVDYTH